MKGRHVAGALVVAAVTVPLLLPLATADGPDTLWRVLRGDGVVLANTAVVALTTAVLATATAWAAAHAHAHHSFRGRTLAHLLCLAPLLLPPPTIALALVALTGHNGVLTRHLGLDPLAYGAPGLVAAATCSALPYAYLVLLHGITLTDPRLADAATALGAGPGVLARRELTALRPTLAVAALVVVAHTVADLADPLVLGGGYAVLATRLFEAATAENDLADAAAHGILLTLTCLLVALAVGHLGGATRPAPHRSPLHRRPVHGVGARLVVAVQAAAATAVALAVAVVLTGATGVLDGSAPTLHPLRAVLTGPFRPALADTVLAGVLATAISLPIGVHVGRRLADEPPRRLHPAAILQAVPSLVHGLVAWIVLVLTATPLARFLPPGTPVGERQTWALLVTVLVVTSAPTTAATVADAVRRLPAAPRDGALALGARPADLHRDLLLPALRPVLGAEIATTFARSVATLAPVALLSTSRTPLLPVELVTAAEHGRLADACAMATTLGVLVAAVAALTVTDAAPHRRTP